MKKKMLILCSLITLLLAAFQFPIYADEDPSDPPSSVPVPNSIRLDQYFFDNYDLLPYIESNGQQTVDTGVIGSGNQKIDIKFSYFDNTSGSVFVSSGNDLRNSVYVTTGENSVLYFYTYTYSYPILKNIYNMYNLSADKNVWSINGQSHTFAEQTFSINNSYKLFNNKKIRIYNFSIYDYDSDSYSVYYYPAKTKAGNVIGFYDAVSDTFVTTSGSVPFASPINDQVLNFQIGTFITSGLGWIGDILAFAIETPIILIFMAIGLAGVIFRWGRRLVHF